jgi:hypothetical protein
MGSETTCRSAFAVWLLLVGMLAPRLVAAGEVDLGASLGAGYDSNVFNRRKSERVDSGVIQLEARGEAKDELEFGSYLVRYAPSYIINTASRANNLWNQRAYAEGTYVFSPRTRLTVAEDFSLLEQIVYGPDNPPPDANVDDSNRRILTNTASLAGTHLLDPLTTLWGNTQYSINRYKRSNEDDNDYLAGQAGVYRAITPRLSLGGGGSVSYRSFDDPSEVAPVCNSHGPGSRTLAYSFFASGSYQIDPTAKLELRAGPAQLETTVFSCDPSKGIFRPVHQSQTTWFAEGSLGKRWQHVASSVRYSRSEGLGNAGSSTVNDSLVARVSWQFARLWDVGVRGSWIQRTQQGVRQFDGGRSSTDTTTWIAAGALRHRVLERLSVFLNASYRTQKQDIKNESRLPSNYDTYSIIVGLDYELDPIRY